MDSVVQFAKTIIKLHLNILRSKDYAIAIAREVAITMLNPRPNRKKINTLDEILTYPS